MVRVEIQANVQAATDEYNRKIDSLIQILSLLNLRITIYQFIFVAKKVLLAVLYR